MKRIYSSSKTRVLAGCVFTLFSASHPRVWAQNASHHLSEPEIEDLEAYQNAKVTEFYQRIDQIKRETEDYKASQLAGISKPGPGPKSKGVGPGSGVPTALGTGMLYGGALGAAGGAAGGNAGLGAAIGAGVVGLIMAGMALLSSLFEMVTAVVIVIFAQTLNQPEISQKYITRFGLDQWVSAENLSHGRIVFYLAITVGIIYLCKNLFAAFEKLNLITDRKVDTLMRYL